MDLIENEDDSKVPWNQGKLVGQKAPLKLKEIWGIRSRLQVTEKFRDLALFNLGLDSKLRGCDLVSIRVSDITSGGVVSKRAMVMQHKTKKPVQFEITEGTREAVADWIKKKGLNASDYLFPSRKFPGQHLSTRQYGKIVDRWVTSIGLDPGAYGTHSMRRTKPTLIYRRTRTLRAVQLLLGHTKMDSTIRYLGVEVEDALELAEKTDI